MKQKLIQFRIKGTTKFAGVLIPESAVYFRPRIISSLASLKSYLHECLNGDHDDWAKRKLNRIEKLNLVNF